MQKIISLAQRLKQEVTLIVRLAVAHRPPSHYRYQVHVYGTIFFNVNICVCYTFKAISLIQVYVTSFSAVLYCIEW